MEISFELIGLLFAVAVLVGAIDTLAGGGGLITIPALMLSGMSPINALGTNKLQGCLGTGTATVLLLRKSKIRLRHIRPLVIGTFLGSALGTVAVHSVNQKYLTLAVPLVLTFIAVYFILYKSGRVSKPGRKVSGKTFTYAVIPSIGFF